MVAKEMAKRTIDSLPDNATLDDVIHALYIRAKFEHGERQIREGRGIPHEQAKQRIQKWVK